MTGGAVALSAGRFRAAVIPFGAALMDLAVDGRSVVLGFGDPCLYPDHSPHFGSVAGRCANRIRDGRFDLDGRSVALTRNAGGGHHLHGGARGFGSRMWTVTGSDGASVDLALLSEDGDEGYPGRVAARCRYSLNAAGLVIDLAAETDAPTLVNLATHSYFDLDRGASVLDHRLTVAAEAYVETDDQGIPTGAVPPVAGTRFDFRAARRFGDAVAAGPVDHNFALSAAPSAVPRFAARLEGAVSGIVLEVWTTEPGLQVYDGNKLGPAVPLADGRLIGPHGGLCLEPQRFPDAVHHPHFPSAVLRPGEVYRQRTEYRFSRPA